MHQHAVRNWKIGLLILAALLFVPNFAMAGPPLVCHPFHIGGAPSLPWGSEGTTAGWQGSLASYDTNHLAEDTLNLLTPQVPVIVRMETLRRAAIYSAKNPQAAKETILKLKARIENGEAQGHPDAMAEFDYGYFAESLKQANWEYPRDASGAQRKVVKPNVAMNVDGLSYVEKAIGLRGSDGEMELAAALITLDGRGEMNQIHAQRALAGAKNDSLLAQNIQPLRQ